jgi:hypothetical protein
MADDHERLAAALEARGPEALREHLGESAAAVLALLEERRPDAGTAAPDPPRA